MKKNINIGKECELEGIRYEKIIYNIVKNCKLNDSNINFNTQKESELGCKNKIESSNDIICNFTKEFDLPVEIKKKDTPDWMQCILKPINNTWVCSPNCKIPEKSRDIFQNLLKDINLYGNNIPPFMNKKLTYEEWLEIKKETGLYKDVFLNIPSDTIKKLYQEKNCFYIQISEKGLYHLGNDICNFGVPEFICEQEIRIRIKVNTKKDYKGFCKLSVMAACKPININKLEKSKYSLDNIKKLPKNLKYIKNNQ